MLPAGLSFNAVSEKALEASKTREDAALVLGLGADHRRQRGRLLAVHVGHQPALRAARGARDCCARRAWRTSSRATRATPRRPARRSHGWGLEVLALDEREFSGSLTAVVLDGSDEVRRDHPRALRHVARRRPRASSQDQVFRIGHLGDFNDLMLAGTLCGVQMGLKLAGPRRRRRRRRGAGAARRVTGALDGVRVIELSQVMAGPFCGQVLARHGRRRGQGRAARGRRPDAPLDGRGRVPRRQPQQAHRSRSTSRTPATSRSCTGWSRPPTC